MQLIQGRIPLTQAEADAVDTLIGKHQKDSVSITRRDPDESGNLLVHVGDNIYEVDENEKISN